MRHLRLLSLLTLVAIIALGAVPGGVVAAPIPVSGTSPYATCTVGGTPTSTNYVNAEVEPYVAVNPHETTNLIGAWQQDRWSDGGAHGEAAAFSNDGGTTWVERTLPFSKCAPGGLPYDRASDPWVSIGPDGTAYTISLSFNVVDNQNNAVAAATSTSGGATWSAPVILDADNSPRGQTLIDKESVTADPVKAGTAYAVWDKVSGPLPNARAAAHVFGFTGPAFFAKTTDGGRTWSAAKRIVFTGNHSQTIGNQIVVDPRTGTLYDFFDLIFGTNNIGKSKGPTGTNVAYAKSTDGGDTWTDPQIINSLQSVGVPNTRTGDIIPEPAIDPATGQLYVVWQDSRFNGGNYDEIALSTSGDGGATWSAPIRVNDATGQPAFTPMVAVNSQGTVGVSYYQYLSQTSAALPTNYYLKKSPDHGASFGAALLQAGPFDMMTAPNARGFFVGDYEGLATIGAVFQPFFVATNSGNIANRTDVFTTNS